MTKLIELSNVYKGIDYKLILQQIKNHIYKWHVFLASRAKVEHWKL